MSESNPYVPPKAAVSDESIAADSAIDRRKLVPLWIKIFGWIFMTLGVVGPVTAVVQTVLHMPGTYEMFGLVYQGSGLDQMGLVILAIGLLLAVSAYGLLFGKPWGLNACMATGCGCVAICLGTMAYGVATRGVFVFRLELLVLAPYLLKLHKIKPLWLSSGRDSRS